jgi:DNA (cytosine-5)-methyltransferase 1
VAQRRRRVFVVGYLGDWRVAAAVLFERESLQGNPKPSRKKREEVTANAEGSVRNPSTPRVSNALCARDYKGARPEADQGAPLIIDRAAFNQGENAQYEPRIEEGETMSSLVAKGPHAVAQPIAVDWRTAQVDQGITQTLKTDLAKMSGPCIAVDTYNYTTNDHTTQTIRSQSDTEHIGAVLQPIAVDVYNQSIDGQTSATITEAVGGTNTSGPKVMHSMAIRRLTPKECERLQGFPDDWTKIPYRNKEADQCPDGPRYKACGNSMAVPVMRWIGERINLIESML